MARDIIIRPIISEKADILASKHGKYSFVVDKSANKLQVLSAFKSMFPEVTPMSVSTLIVRGKTKTRNTKSGVLKGSTGSYKKAIITLSEGDELDIYGSDS